MIVCILQLTVDWWNNGKSGAMEKLFQFANAEAGIWTNRRKSNKHKHIGKREVFK